jgi:type II secretory pathway pseudopilin PulG
MTKSPLRSSAGFTYIAALVMVVIMGIMLARAAEYWTTRMQREREVELIFRGTQIRDAMRRCYGMTLNANGSYRPPGVPAPATPGLPDKIPDNALRINELKDLLQATTSAGKKRFLRGSEKGPNLVDPITGKDWALVQDPATKRIIGVASKSEAAPIKQGNFPFDLEPADFENKKKYSEWQFICNRYPKPAGTVGGATGLRGTSGNPGTSGTSGTSGTPGTPGTPDTSGSPGKTQ